MNLIGHIFVTLDNNEYQQTDPVISTLKQQRLSTLKIRYKLFKYDQISFLSGKTFC